MKIIVFGSQGQLGTDLMQRARQDDLDAVGAGRPLCDITDPASVERSLSSAGAVDVAINAAAYTAVDRAEGELDSAFAVNRDGAGILARECHRRDIPLIHLSTDYVFEGLQTRPYRHDDPVEPRGVYACSKAQGEEAVRRHHPQHLIVRVSWLFGRHGHNFVKTMLRLGRKRDSLSVVDDQIGSPTYAGDLADALLSVARIVRGNFDDWGTYHYCNDGALTWYAFARKIFALARPYESLAVREVTQILTRHYPTPAPRPHYSVLDCSRFDEVFAIPRRPWQEALKEMLAALYAADENQE